MKKKKKKKKTKPIIKDWLDLLIHYNRKIILRAYCDVDFWIDNKSYKDIAKNENKKETM